MIYVWLVRFIISTQMVYSIVHCIYLLMLTIYLCQCIMIKYLIPNWFGTKLIRMISTYIKKTIAESVSVLSVPACIQNCSDKCCHCVSHRADISQHYNKLVDIMVSATEHIPRTCKPNENTCVPGWTTYVKPFKDKSMYWKEMYDSQKPNVSHYTTYMMKKSEIRKCFIQP